MADTLAEIYRATLTESDFNSSGEATIFTTNSSTSHVIKGVQAEEVDSSLLLAGSLDVNGFSVVGLTGNSSGTEIIAPSSTIKVKTNAIPLTYTDDRFYVQSTSTNSVSAVDAKANGVIISSKLLDTTNPLGVSLTTNANFRQAAPALGPNSNTWFYRHDDNSSHISQLYNSSGSGIFSENTSYIQKWFDGYRYVYFIGSGNSGVDRLDTWSTSGTVIEVGAGHWDNSNSTYGRLFGIRDKWVFFWPIYNNARGYALNLQTNVVQDFTTNPVSNVFTSGSMARQFYAVEVNNGYRIIRPNSGTGLSYWDWDGSEILDSSSAGAGVELNFNGSSQQNFKTSNQNKKVTIGSKLYYINEANNLAYIEFEGTPAWGGELTSNAFAATAPYGPDVTYVAGTTPTASEVSDRGLSVNIGLKLRITGVTTT